MVINATMAGIEYLTISINKSAASIWLSMRCVTKYGAKVIQVNQSLIPVSVVPLYSTQETIKPYPMFFITFALTKKTINIHGQELCGKAGGNHE